MSKNRIIPALTALFVAASTSATLAQPAIASGGIKNNTPASTSENARQIDSYLAENGVSIKDRSVLLKKYNAGVVWDSLAGKKPVGTTTRIQNGQSIKIDKYADGSISISTVDLPKSTQSVRAAGSGVSGCTLSSGTHYSAVYTGCYASADLIIVKLAFHFDRNTYNGGQGTITRAYAGEHRCIGCTLSNLKFERMSPSQMRYSGDGSVLIKGFPAGGTAWMQANQGIGTDITVTHN